MQGGDELYLKILLDPIKTCAEYKPRFGQGAPSGGLTLQQFQSLYKADSLYSWFGLDNPLMYTAHRAAGGMTSLYRQIGIGCERLFSAYPEYPVAKEDWLGHSAAMAVHPSGFIRRPVRRLFG